MQQLRTLFDRYNLIHPTTRPHDPCVTLYISNKQKNAVAARTEHLTERDLLDESRYYPTYPIATSSFTPRYAPVTPSSSPTSTTSNETL